MILPVMLQSAVPAMHAAGLVSQDVYRAEVDTTEICELGCISGNDFVIGHKKVGGKKVLHLAGCEPKPALGRGVCQIGIVSQVKRLLWRKSLIRRNAYVYRCDGGCSARQ